MARVFVAWSADWPVTVAAVPGAVAVVVGDRVLACSAQARAAGVRRRMPVRAAQARCPALVIVERDLAAETRMFERVARALEEVTPRLEVIRPGLAALPAPGPARYAGGEQALAKRVHALAGSVGVQVRVGIADTVFAAALAARAAQLVPAGRTPAFLAPYPVGTLGRPRLTELLPRLGIETLGAFAALPTGRVLSRFGAEGAAAQRTARGLELRGLDTRVPSQSYAVHVDLDPPAQLLEPLVFTAKQLAQELHRVLAGAGAVCGQVEIAATLVGGRELARRWRHEGRLSTLALAERVRWQLQAWLHAGDLDADPGADPDAEAGIARLALVPHQLTAATGQQALLWGDAHREEIEGAAARLQVRLGHSAVTRMTLVGGRGPGERQLRVPFGDLAERPRAVEGPWPGQLPGPHPAAVYGRMPSALLVDATGRSVAVTARSEVSAPPAELHVEGWRAAAVTGWSGPWTLDESWWSPTEAQRTARLQVTAADGRAWLLRLERGRWWAEACYG